MDRCHSRRPAPSPRLTFHVLTQIAELDDEGGLTAIREVVSIGAPERDRALSAEQAAIVGLL